MKLEDQNEKFISKLLKLLLYGGDELNTTLDKVKAEFKKGL